MIRRPFLLARIALFAALVYVLSWGTSYLPNVNFIFIIVFSAGFLWGLIPGMAVGAIGMGLWTLFNPYGPAPLPIMLAQTIGASGSGIVGALFRRVGWAGFGKSQLIIALVIAACLSTLLFYVPVNVIDAWLFGPFTERFVGGMLWAGISLGFNIIIFPLLFGAARYLYEREGKMA